jgi:hypothetical protein
MQYCLGPQGVVLDSSKALGDEFCAERGLRKVASWIPSRSGTGRLINNIDLITLLKEPRRPASASVRLVQEVLTAIIVSCTLIHKRMNLGR